MNRPVYPLEPNLIVFEGGEGSGKTTVIERLRQEPEFPGALFTREPGGTSIGEHLRSILKDPQLSPDPWTELFLLMAGRRQLTHEVLRPAFASGRLCFSDRSFLSTYAYQWYAGFGETDPDEFMHLVSKAGIPFPGLVLWHDVDPRIALDRIGAVAANDRFDAKDISFHQRVRQGYQYLFTQYEPWTRIVRRIDAAAPANDVYAQVRSALSDYSRSIKGR